MIGDRDLAPPRQGIDGDEQGGRAVAGVFAIAPLDLARLGWQGVADLPGQLLGGFVQAHHGMLGIGWPVIHVQHVFHVIDEFGVGDDAFIVPPFFKCLETLKLIFGSEATRTSFPSKGGNDPLVLEVGSTDLVRGAGHNLLSSE
jgi:hypothetical protein